MKKPTKLTSKQIGQAAHLITLSNLCQMPCSRGVDYSVSKDQQKRFNDWFKGDSKRKYLKYQLTGG